ncbi:unnamed protein product [Paramecium sonneborni]|uniref:Uncharacterized protein n=1 Tax=Paramecium sonneborni TaxID=65129 RepID=A0A8S1QRZ9_9CILI|nr:unnamed protein product [Paramecium sonneborni]
MQVNQFYNNILLVQLIKMRVDAIRIIYVDIIYEYFINPRKATLKEFGTQKLNNLDNHIKQTDQKILNTKILIKNF